MNATMNEVNGNGKKVKKGWPNLRCPLCGEENGIRIDVAELKLECSGCGEEVKRADVEKLIAQWNSLLAWIETAPAR